MIKFILATQLVFFFTAGVHIKSIMDIQKCAAAMSILESLSIEQLGDIQTNI